MRLLLLRTATFLMSLLCIRIFVECEGNARSPASHNSPSSVASPSHNISELAPPLSCHQALLPPHCHRTPSETQILSFYSIEKEKNLHWLPITFRMKPKLLGNVIRNLKAQFCLSLPPPFFLGMARVFICSTCFFLISINFCRADYLGPYRLSPRILCSAA